MSEQMNETAYTCAEHGDALIWEPGGADMPTLRGRWYCLTCQRLFTEVLERMSTPPGQDAS